MAQFVTRHVQNPLDEFRFLLCGIDTLDVGLFVNWDNYWPDRLEYYQNKKEESFGNKGLLDQTSKGRHYIHHPSGKPPRYRFHIQFPEYHLFIGISKEPKLGTPNLYASFASESLWLLGIDKLTEQLKTDISCFGGVLQIISPSRIDLAADFLIPNGLTYDFLMQHRVSRSRANSSHFTDECLETCYFGDKDSPIRLRIYDKSLEVQRGGVKDWFIPLWGIEENRNVWRIEYQIRRAVLKQFGVNSLSDLYSRIGGIWENFTTEWFSLRLKDNEKTERRTTHPFWFDVQACASRFGDLSLVEREYLCDCQASIDWYISQTSGFTISIAARLGNPNRDEIFKEIQYRIKRHCPDDKFLDEYAKRRIGLGKQVNQGDDDEEYPF